MRSTVLFTAAALLAGVALAAAQPTPKDGKKDDKAAPADATKPTAAAEVTRAKALKAKMSVDFKDSRLGDVLKEFAAQVDMRADVTILWAYDKDFPFAKKVSYTCKDKPLDAALDELLKTGGLGYVVVSKGGDKYDGWVRLTTTGERGYEKGAEPMPPPPPATAAEEADAVEKLALAKKLIEAKKDEQAKTVLTFILKRYPGAKAAAEAKALLEKLTK
jgi:hypothetical protein